MNQDRLGWHSLGTTFDCACGLTHHLPIDTCYVGADAAARLGEYSRQFGSRAYVVSDENTRAVGGAQVLDALTQAKKELTEYVYGSDPVDATDTLGEELRAAADGTDFIVAIGSGSLCDLAKYAGDKLGIPVILFATAASMNGYTSAIVALKVRGLKRTLPCSPARAVFADPAVVATAPQRMTAAGIADFLSKCSSSSDWRVAHLLHGGYFCERPREFFDGTQERLLQASRAAGEGEPEAVAAVLDALLLSGCSMVIAGSSAPASGGEHLISHYLDMKSAIYGTAHDLHGTQVGVATVYTLGLWEKILDLKVEDIDVEALLDVQPSDEDIMATIDSDWGPVAEEVRQQWARKRPTRDALRSELLDVIVLLPTLRDQLAVDLLPSAVVAEAIAAAGGPVTPEDLTVPIEEYRNALERARYIRDRFTVLDLAVHLGV